MQQIQAHILYFALGWSGDHLGSTGNICALCLLCQGSDLSHQLSLHSPLKAGFKQDNFSDFTENTVPTLPLHCNKSFIIIPCDASVPSEKSLHGRVMPKTLLSILDSFITHYLSPSALPKHTIPFPLTLCKRGLSFSIVSFIIPLNTFSSTLASSILWIKAQHLTSQETSNS